MKSFNELPIQENLLKAIEELNYVTPSEIQAQAIPVVLEGHDIIGQAQTGTGKTAAYSIPMIEKINPEDRVIQSLVLCPTRELAIQVTEEIRKLYKFIDGIKVVPVYGGQSYDIQIRALKGRPQIIVGTPGRMIDLMNRKLLKFDDIRMLVLDEADEMLKMGFQEDLETILGAMPKSKQTCMFSATMPDTIKNIANKYLHDYKHIQVAAKTMTVEKIEQSYYIVKTEEKIDLLMRLFDFYQFTTAIVFCNTKKDVDELVVKLQSHDYVTEGLHGDLKQNQRDRVMNSFRRGNVQILVATDVAARGLDVDDVDAVFNFDIPQEEEIYVHRIGRTGRAGRTGKSFTFITKRQTYRLKDVERFINQQIPEGKIPSVEEIKERHSSTLFELIKEMIDKNPVDKPHPIVERLLIEGYTTEQIFQALMSHIASETQKDYNEITQVFEIERKRNKREPKNGNKRSEKPRRQARGGRKVTVYMNAGSKNNVKVGSVLRALENSKISRGDIGKIEINKKGTYVELYEKDAERVSRTKINLGNQDVNPQIIQQ